MGWPQCGSHHVPLDRIQFPMTLCRLSGKEKWIDGWMEFFPVTCLRQTCLKSVDWYDCQKHGVDRAHPHVVWNTKYEMGEE